MRSTLAQNNDQCKYSLCALLQDAGDSTASCQNANRKERSQIQALESRSAAATQPDYLQRIEGVGPKISRLLQDAGITTFSQLVATPVSRLRQILADADLSALAAPTTWSEQAKFAAEGDWAGLGVLQDKLKGGRRLRAAPLIGL